MIALLAASVVLACSHAGAAKAPDDATPVKVFVLAGQSNMEGQAVVDLGGTDYNGGKGTLQAVLADPATGAAWAHLRAKDGQWTVRDDVWARYTPEGKQPRTGALGLGFTPYLDAHHFGPELEIGQVLGNAIDAPVLLVKTAWGGKSLYVDFRPPSSGGTAGPYYRRMISDVQDAIAHVGDDFPALKGRRTELAGLIWYQGWNDGCDPKRAVPEYEQNLVNLINDVRRDLGAPKLPVVVGELTGPWVKAPGEWDALRKAQAAAAARPEFRGNVVFVPTAAYVRDPEQSPNPGHGHHEFGNAETYLLVGDALGRAMRSLAVPGSPAFVPTLPKATATKPAGKPAKAEMAGYMLVPTEKVPDEFNAGFSLYAAAWPVLDRYPGHRFQTGLFGTWMHAQYEGKPPKDLYSDIEGGLGWWRDTRFPTETPKFIMGGVAVNFGEIANGPAHGAGDWKDPRGLYGVAQLSPRLLFPIDGMNLRQGTCGELFGYGYLPLPLATPRAAGADGTPAMGANCWTLFLNTANFKGPVCFFTPWFWARSAKDKPELAGLLLDTRASDPNKAFQMETQYVPALLQAPGAGGEDAPMFARVAPMSFPANADGRTVVLHRITSYRRSALFDAVERWFNGGAPASGAIDPAGASLQAFKQGGGSTWKLYPDGAPKEERTAIDWASFAKPWVPDPTTYGYEWDPRLVKRVTGSAGGARVRIPEWFRLDPGPKARWTVVAAKDVPASTGLAAARFERPSEKAQPAYDTPSEKDSAWGTPGPAAGPFQVTLGDGSVVTYCWYRFADQPALQHANMTRDEREAMQRKVELLHRNWPPDRDYLPPNTVGTLAQLDPAQLVKPPKGLEIGFVPIATRQEMPPKPARATK
jgi:hypothetical protein